jgi:hypothetical protein
VVELLAILWPLPALWALVACVAGRRARTEERHGFSARLQLMLACVVALALLAVAALSDLPVLDRAALGGVVLVGAAAPTLAFYALGYAVRRPRVAGALWLAGTLPLAAYTGIALFGLMSYTFCAGWDCQGGFD